MDLCSELFQGFGDRLKGFLTAEHEEFLAVDRATSCYGLKDKMGFVIFRDGLGSKMPLAQFISTGWTIGSQADAPEITDIAFELQQAVKEQIDNEGIAEQDPVIGWEFIEGPIQC